MTTYGEAIEVLANLFYYRGFVNHKVKVNDFYWVVQSLMFLKVKISMKLTTLTSVIYITGLCKI